MKKRKLQLYLRQVQVSEAFRKTALIRTVQLVKAGTLQADPRFIETELEALLFICNGCGAAGKVDLIPDTMYGLYVGYVCFIHDFDYKLGLTEADRRFADLRFKENLLKLIAIEGGPLWIPRRVRVNTYYKSVRLCGEQPFWAGKEINKVTLGVWTAEAMAD
jgi:hypothetical protein